MPPSISVVIAAAAFVWLAAPPVARFGADESVPVVRPDSSAIAWRAAAKDGADLPPHRAAIT
jgi:hypothetical protein